MVRNHSERWCGRVCETRAKKRGKTKGERATTSNSSHPSPTARRTLAATLPNSVCLVWGGRWRKQRKSLPVCYYFSTYPYAFLSFAISTYSYTGEIVCLQTISEADASSGGGVGCSLALPSASIPVALYGWSVAMRRWFALRQKRWKYIHRRTHTASSGANENPQAKDCKSVTRDKLTQKRLLHTFSSISLHTQLHFLFLSL